MAKIDTKGRLLYIEPNNIPQEGVQFGKGVTGDNITFSPEDFSMYVDLQVIVPRITDKMKYHEEYFDVSCNNVSPTYISFLQGSELEQRKSKNDDNKEGINELTDSFTEISSTYSEIGTGARDGREHLGINKIDINFNSQFFPQVKMSLTDVRGSALMASAEQDRYEKNKNGIRNFYSALFHFPYPRFLLTIKGFYGNKITFILAVEDVKTALNASTGNFDVNISFIGYMYGLYTDIPFSYLIAAPYIGGTNNNGTDKLETNSYWSEKEEFCFSNSDGSSGEHICTFIEFLERYQEASDKIRKGDLYLTQDIRDYTKARLQLSAIAELKDCFKKSIEELENENKNYIISSYSDDYFTIHFLTKNEILFSQEDNTKFFNLFEKYKENYNNSLTQNTWQKKVEKATCTRVMIDGNSLLYQTTLGDKMLNKQSSKLKEIYSKFPNEEKSYRIESFENFIANNITKFNSNTYYYILWTDNFEGQLQKEYEAIEYALNSDLMQSANEDMGNAVALALGFRPSLENIFRMVFAHLDTFIHFINKTVSSIDDNRKLKDYLSKDETNITTDGILPPFFGYYREGKDNKREFTYPGKSAKMRSFPEVQLVEDICNGVLACQNKARKLSLELSSATTANTQDITETSENGETFNGNFTPTLFTDLFRQINPYEKYKTDEKEFSNTEDECGLIYYYFYSRIFSALLEKKDINDSFIETEAKNFHEANTKLRRNVFPQLKDNSNAFTKYSNFVKKKNAAKNYLFSYSEDNSSISIKKENVVVAHSPLRNNESNIIKKVKDFDGIIVFNEERVKLYKEKLSETDNIIITGTTYYEKNYGRVYYDDSDGTDAVLRRFKTKYYPSECTDYDSFIAWVKESKEERIKECRYPILQLGDNGKYVKNLLDDEDFQKLSSTENGQYKQGLLFLAAISSPPANDYMAKGMTSFIQTLPRYFALYIGGLLYRKENSILTSDKEFFQSDKNASEDIIYNSGVNRYLSKYNSSPDLAHTDWLNFDIPALKESFIKWCDSDFTILIDEFNNLKNSEKRKVWSINNSGTNILALPDETQDRILDLYFDTVTIGRLVLEEEKIKFKKLSKHICSFAEKLYSLYSDDEKNSTGAANDETESKDDDTAKITEEIKTSTYYNLSNLYTKWLVTFTEKSFSLKKPKDEIDARKNRFEKTNQDSKESTEYGNFLFLDSYQNDISQSFFVNVELLYERIKSVISGNAESSSVYEFMANIAQDNKLLFLSLPVYNNFYNADTLAGIFTPQSIFGENSKGTLGYGNTYILMYTHEVSKFLDTREDEDVRVADDRLDMADTWGDIYPVSLEYFRNRRDENEVSISIPSFGVTYATQNQNIFKNISVNMETPQITDYSILNQLQIANTGAHGDSMRPKGVGQNLYSVYSNRSYTCTVEMLGCMNIMPLMYFQLNNMPMFKGAYMIISVEHHISAGDITTQFTGIRISKNQITLSKSIFSLENLIDKLNANATGIKDKGHLVGGNSNYSGQSKSTSETVSTINRNISEKNIGKNAGSIIWDEKNELIIPSATVTSKEFNIVKAVSEMSKPQFLKWKENGVTKEGTITPSVNSNSTHNCAQAVKTFAIAGGIKAWSGANGAYCYNILAERGFGVYTRGLKTIEERKEWEKNYAQAGDIALMEHNDTPGHICMYDGRRWISDFSQNNMWVYNDQPKSDIIIMRYTGPRILPGEKIGNSSNVDFYKFAPILKVLEGGNSNVEGDKGGYTISGVTQSTYYSIYHRDVTNITETEWEYIIYHEFWDKLKCDQIANQAAANLVADWGVNSGAATAAKKVNAFLGLGSSGTINSQTLIAINKKIKEDNDFISKLANKRIEYYEDLVENDPSQEKFLEGWKNRINKLLSASQA